MNAMRSIYYTVVLPTGRERTLLDAIRLFARPATRHPAHVTLRGPYEDYRDPRTWSAAVRGSHALVEGVDEFVNANSTAVYLRVHAPTMQALKDVAGRPDSPMHVTLYDGNSPEFAGRLRFPAL